MQARPPLTNLQVELLKVFSREVSADDLVAIKQLVSNYFAQKAATLADAAWEQEGFSEETMQQWRETHLRTGYKPTQTGEAKS